MWWMIGLILLAGILFYFYRRPGGIPLLRATVSTADGNEYFVTYDHLHTDTQPVEYVRISLNLAAKIIHIVPPSDARHAYVKGGLLACMSRVSNADIKENSDLFQICDRNAFLGSSSANRTKSIVANLYFKSAAVRHVTTSLPATWFEDQLVDTWIAVTQEGLRHIKEPFLIARLQSSLAVMCEMYSDPRVDASSLQALHGVPNEAFMLAQIQ